MFRINSKVLVILFSFILFSQMPLTVFGIHTDTYPLPRKQVSSFEIDAFDNKNQELFFQFPESVKDAINIGVRCNGIDGIFLNKIAYGSRPLFTPEDSDYTFNPEFNEKPLPLTSTLTGTSIPSNDNILVATSVLPYSIYTTPAINSTWFFNHYLFHPDTNRNNADFFTDSDYTVTYFDTGSGFRFTDLNSYTFGTYDLTSDITVTKYPRWDLSYNPEIVNSTNISLHIERPTNDVHTQYPNADFPAYSKAIRIYSHDSNAFSGVSVKDIIKIVNATNRESNITLKYKIIIDSSPTFKGIIASYMDVLQDNFHTIQLLESFISTGPAVKQIEVKKGDLLFMFSNKDNPDVNTDNWLRLYSANLDENFQFSAFDTNPYAGMRLEVHAFKEDAVETIFQNNVAGNYNQGYHLKPVYDFDTLHQGTGSSNQIIIPKYYFSNIVETQCIGYAFFHKLYDNTEFQSSEPVTINIQQKPRCSGNDDFTMPATNKIVSMLSLTFKDIRPDDYCVNSSDSLFTRHVNVTQFNATSPNLVLVPDLIGYFIDDDEGEGQYSYYFFALPPPGAPDNTQTNFFPRNPSGGHDSGCLVRFDIDGSYWKPTVAGFNRGGVYGLAMALEIDGDDAPKYRPSPLSLSCVGMTIYIPEYGGEYIVDHIEKNIPTHQPFYKSIINDINNDVWGWGVGADKEKIPDAIGYATFNNTIMGVPFLMIMVLFSAMVGYQRQHLPASLIIFFAIIGSATYLTIIELPVGIISGILVLVILGIFSRGFK